jgi:hypothetical protein
MSEFAWWYLYIQIINEENIKRKEMYDVIELLLPWLNLELWQEVQKNKESGRENADFESQLRSMLYGTWNTDPNAPQFAVDELTSSVEAPIDVKSLFDQSAPPSRGTFNQPPWNQGNKG